MDLRETYNKIAEDWSKDHKLDDWWIVMIDKFASFLKPGAKILDVGCGSGDKSDYLIKKGFNLTGIDFSEKMIEIAKRDVPEGIFFVMDMLGSEEVEGSFDAIFMQASLLHIPKKDAQSVVSKFVHKLNKGGVFLVAVKETKPNRPEEEIKTEDDYGYKYDRFFSYFTSDEIKTILKNANISVLCEDVKPTGNTRWIQIIGKYA